MHKKGIDIVTFVDESLYADYTTNTWWVDSGATIHVANTVQGFATRRTLRRGERRIRVANGVEAEVEAIGVLHLTLHTGFTLRLKDVLYVPSMRRNLVSVSCLDDDGLHCHFGDKRYIIKCNDNDVGLAFRQDKLYLISLCNAVNNVDPSLSMNIGTKRKRNETSSKLWHCRSDHISRGRIERLIKEQILHPLDFSDADTCIDCIKGKYAKQIKKGAIRST